MARLVVLYRTPTDPAAFDKYYRETHIPITKMVPGLRKYEISVGPIVSPGGPSSIHLVATLHFEDLAAIQNAFASPRGLAAGADMQKFATGGADMLMFEAASL